MVDPSGAGPARRWVDRLPEDLARAAEADAPPGSTKERWDWALAVLHDFLGDRWLRNELTGRRGARFLMINPAHQERPGDGHLRVFRAEGLAVYLLAARRVPGFGRFLTEMRTRSLVEVMAELRTLMHLLRAGRDVELLSPRETEGVCPEARFTLSGETVWVEVKSKQEQPAWEYRPSKVTSSLKAARGQLPSQGPGLIYLQLPPAWGTTRQFCPTSTGPSGRGCATRVGSTPWS